MMSIHTIFVCRMSANLQPSQQTYWMAEFQRSMMTEFKEEDDEQMRYNTEVYLQKAAFDIRTN